MVKRKKYAQKNLVQINHSLLEGLGHGSPKPSDFARIRNWGDKNFATTFDNKKVERQDYLFSLEYSQMVRCCPYELHFVYHDPMFGKKSGRWNYMCTCGSIAGIVSYKDVATLMSPKLGERILVCIAHTASKQNSGVGVHADGSHE